MDDRTGVKSPDTTAIGTVELAVPPEGRWISVSPLNRRRWNNFKANKRGYWSLWIFLVLFVISLFAEFIANDKPIFINVNGHFYFPAVVTYPDTAFAKKPDPTAVRHRGRLQGSLLDEAHQEARRLRDLAADPLLL